MKEKNIFNSISLWLFTNGRVTVFLKIRNLKGKKYRNPQKFRNLYGIIGNDALDDFILLVKNNLFEIRDK